MTVFEFSDKIKELVEKCEIPEEKEFLNDILLLKPKRKGIELKGDFIEDLYNNFIMSGRIIGFSFNSRLEKTDKFKFFATQDVFSIGIDLSTGEVIMYDEEKEEIYLKLAENLDEFLTVLLIIFEYGLAGWCYDKKYTSKDRHDLYTLLKDILKKDYLEYYKQTYSN